MKIGGCYFSIKVNKNRFQQLFLGLPLTKETKYLSWQR